MFSFDLDARALLPLLRRFGVEARPVSGECRHVEIDAVGRDIRVALRDEPLDQRDHLGDVIRRLRDHLRIENVQLVPVVHEEARVFVRDLEWRLPRPLGADGHLVATLVGIARRCARRR